MQQGAYKKMYYSCFLKRFNQFLGEILECPICQLTVEAMEKILANPKIDHDVEHVLEKTCRGVPSQYRNKVRFKNSFAYNLAFTKTCIALYIIAQSSVHNQYFGIIFLAGF